MVGSHAASLEVAAVLVAHFVFKAGQHERNSGFPTAFKKPEHFTIIFTKTKIKSIKHLNVSY